MAEPRNAKIDPDLDRRIRELVPARLRLPGKLSDRIDHVLRDWLTRVTQTQAAEELRTGGAR